MRVTRFVLLLVPFLTVSCGWIGETFFTTRTPCDYYLPAGFVGWARVNYGVRNAPETPRQSGRYVFRFRGNGVINTSTRFESGSARDRYFYYSKGGVRELRETAWGGGGSVWAGSVRGSTGDTNIGEEFFIGTEKQYFKAVHDPRGDQ